MSTNMKPIYLDLTEVAAATTLATATIQKLVREAAFPKPRLLSGRRVGWLVREVEEWAEQRPVADLLPPENTARKKADVS